MAEKKGREAPGGEDEELSFEGALKRLEDIVAELEGGRLSLEESLSRFEEGTRLTKLCQAKLKGVELKIEKLVADGGRMATRPLDDEDD